MGERFQLPQLELVALIERRKENLLVLERRLRVVGALDVGAEEAGELEHLAGGPEHRAIRIDDHAIRDFSFRVIDVDRGPDGSRNADRRSAG